MIPDAEVILAAARRALGDPGISEKAIRAAVYDARQLARSETDEVAAVFFAFARRPRAFPKHGRKMVDFLTRDQARAVGIRIEASEEALAALRGRVMRREVGFDAVLQWFAERIPSA